MKLIVTQHGVLASKSSTARRTRKRLQPEVASLVPRLVLRLGKSTTTACMSADEPSRGYGGRPSRWKGNEQWGRGIGPGGSLLSLTR